MVEIVRGLDEQLERVPKVSELPEQCEYSASDFYNKFESWDEALEAAGIDKKQAMLDDIERVAEKLECVPDAVDMAEHGVYTNYPIYFDSWSTALEKSGVEKEYEKLPEEKSEKLLEILRALHDQLDRVPKANELPEGCEYSLNDFYDAFGSWDEALKAAGIDKEQAMLDEIERVAEKLERVPKGTEVAEECEYPQHDFYDAFGSWDEALEAAGINREQELLDEVKRVTEKLGRVPKRADMSEHGVYSASSYNTHFGSWSTALEESGIKGNPGKNSEKFLNILQSLYGRLDRVPKANELPEKCEYSPHDFSNEFGSWDEALEAAGIDKEQELLDEIQRRAEELGRIPKMSEVLQECEYSQRDFYNEFGCWDKALEAAGLDKQQELLGEIERVTEKLGRAPKEAEISEESNYSKYDFYNEFGSWDEVLEAAGKSDTDSSTSPERSLSESDSDDRKAMLRIVRNLQERLGRVPKKTELPEECEYTPVDFYMEFGGWDEALEVAGKSGGDSDASHESSSRSADAEESVTPEQTHSIDRIERRVDGVGRSVIHSLKRAGYHTLCDLSDAQPEEIMKYKGIGPAKAEKLIRFATPWETWDTIPTDERIDREFLCQAIDVDRHVGSRKTARLYVQDQNGKELAIEIWSTHGIDQKWKEGEWYAFGGARGKVWELSDGTIRKELSSTEDLNVVELGADFDPNITSVGDTLDTTSEPQQSGAITDEDVSESTLDSTSSSQNTATTVDNEGVLDDIMSEFDEI